MTLLSAKGHVRKSRRALTRNDAILRHAGEASSVINNYNGLSLTQKNNLITFLNSL